MREHHTLNLVIVKRSRDTSICQRNLLQLVKYQRFDTLFLWRKSPDRKDLAQKFLLFASPSRLFSGAGCRAWTVPTACAGDPASVGWGTDDARAVCRTVCEPSHLTGLVDKLEERKLVIRKVDPNDRRSKLVSLTREPGGRFGTN